MFANVSGDPVFIVIVLGFCILFFVCAIAGRTADSVDTEERNEMGVMKGNLHW